MNSRSFASRSATEVKFGQVGTSSSASSEFLQFGKPLSETWWTHNGSKRKLPGERAIVGAVHYVLYDQPDPLITWSPETGVCYGIPPRRSPAKRCDARRLTRSPAG